MIRRFLPRSLMGQMMLAVAVALLAAQMIGAVLAYRAGAERREAALLHSAAFRLLSARDDDDRDQGRPPRDERRGRGPDFGPGFRGGGGGGRSERVATSPQQAGDVRDHEAEGELRHILADQDFAVADLMVLRRQIARDDVASRRLERQRRVLAAQHEQQPTQVVIAAVRIPERDGWIVARAIVPPASARSSSRCCCRRCSSMSSSSVRSR